MDRPEHKGYPAAVPTDDKLLLALSREAVEHLQEITRVDSTVPGPIEARELFAEATDALDGRSM